MAVTLTNSQLSAGLYSAFWNRAPDATGQNFWVGKLNGGMSSLQVATEFYNAPEGLAAYPNWIRNDNAALVTQVYNSVFEREPDAAGLAFYVAQLKAGTSFPQVVLNMMTNALNSAAAGNTDGLQFQNEIEVGVYVAETLRTDDPSITSVALDGVTYEQSSVAIREAELAQMAAKTYTLTTGADNVKGDAADDIINGTLTANGQQTFQTWDTIDGGSGVNTLNVQNTGANVITAKLANIQNLNFQDQSAAGSAVTLNLQGLSSLNNVTLDGNGAGSGYTINNLGSLPNVTLSGTTVASTINFTSAALQPVGQTFDLTVTGIAGGNGVTISDAGTNALESISITATNADSNVGNLTTTNIGATTLNVAGESNLTLAVNDLSTGGATLTTIDASSATGNLALTTAANTAGSTVTAGAGNDTITSGSAGADSLLGGAGNDTFAMGANFGMTDTIDGGSGANAISTLVANANAYATVQSPVEIANVQTLQITDNAVAATFNAATIATSINAVNFDAGTNGGAAITGNAGAFSVTIGTGLTGLNANLGGALIVTDTGTATTDSLTLNSNSTVNAIGPGLGNALNGQALTSTGYETVTVNTNNSTTVGAQTLGLVTITPDTGGTATLNVTGSNQLTLGAVTATNGTINASGMTLIGSTALGLTMVAGANTATSIVGSGGVDAIFGDNTAGANRNTTVDAGAGADAITTYGGNDSIHGGTGNDTVTSGLGNDWIDAGADNDRVVFLSGQLSANDTVSGGEGTADIISFQTWLDTTDDLAASESRVSNFEILRMLGATAANETVTLSNFINNTGFTSIQLGASGAATGFDFLNAGTALNTINIVDDIGANPAVATTVGNISFDRLTDTTSDSLTVSNTIGLAGAAGTFTTLTALDEETITLTASVPTTAGNNDLNIGAMTVADLTTLNVTSASDVIITGAIIGATQLATVNASTATGAVTVDASNSIQSVTMTGNANSSAATTFTGSATVASSITGGGGADLLTAGVAADTIVGGAGADTITGNNGVDSLTGGVGADDFVMSNIVSGAGVLGVDSVNDFSVAQLDLIGTYGAADLESIVVNGAALFGDLVAAEGAGSIGATAVIADDANVSAAFDLTTLTNNTNVVLVTGNYNAATLQTAIRANVTNSTTAYGAGDGFVVAYDDGASSYVALVTTAAGVVAGAAFADAVVTNITTLVGVADATTLTTGSWLAYTA